MGLLVIMPPFHGVIPKVEPGKHAAEVSRYGNAPHGFTGASEYFVARVDDFARAQFSAMNDRDGGWVYSELVERGLKSGWLQLPRTADLMVLGALSRLADRMLLTSSRREFCEK